MSYEEFYNLKEPPFSITPDPKFFYESEQHLGALIRIQHAIDTSKGLTVMIGDIGLGKTFLSRKILSKLQAEENKYVPALLVIIHHEITALWLLKKIAMQFDIEQPSEDKTSLIGQICEKLVEIDQSNRKAVILMDEAHMLQTKEIYEELRGLLNIETADHKLLNIVLFGPPELEKYMALDPPLVSRIGLKFTLHPLDEKSCRGYILHRMKVAGCEVQVFSDEAIKTIYSFSRGVPRLINLICDNALLEGFLEKRKIIDEKIIYTVATDLGLKIEKNI
jgi:type II secretory pathway predicted ATPase ExeA